MSDINLSVGQQAVVDLLNGAHLVTARAGSGKTRVLTERIKRLLDVTENKILAITFTNKAAEEIQERIGVNERIRDKVFIGTFHSFCQSILELRFKLLGYTAMPHIFEDDSDRLSLIEQAIDQVPYFKDIYSKLQLKQASEYKLAILNFISEVKRNLKSPEELLADSEQEEMLILFETYQDLLLSNNAIDFDDLILLIYNLFINNASVSGLYRRTFEYLCVDEAQDLNRAQYFLLKALVGDVSPNVMLVGDPNQSIYAFNGSSHEFMTECFVKDFSATVHQLNENYRCSRRVVAAANSLIGAPDDSINYVIEGIFKIIPCPTEKAEAEYVYEKIMELVGMAVHPDIEGTINFESIAVLARNRYVFKHVIEIFSKHNVPYNLKSPGGGVKFSSACMKVFDHYFRIKVNPLDKLHATQLAKLLGVNDIYDQQALAVSKIPLSTYAFNFANSINIDNLSLEIKRFRELFEKPNEFALSDDERKLVIDDIDELANSWQIYQERNSKRSLVGFKNAIALGLTNQRNSVNGITLSTVHTMKGQESDIVFLIGMDDGTFPDFRAIAKSGMQLQQEKNNAYVAFTRAKRFLYAVYPETRIMPWGDVKRRLKSRYLKNL